MYILLQLAPLRLKGFVRSHQVFLMHGSLNTQKKFALEVWMVIEKRVRVSFCGTQMINYRFGKRNEIGGLDRVIT